MKWIYRASLVGLLPITVFSASIPGVGPYSGHASATIKWQPKSASSVDQSLVHNGMYYLADRTNAGIHVIDVRTLEEVALIDGFTTTLVNGTINFEVSGPNGLAVLPDRNELYVGDANGTVRVISLATKTIIANITTGAIDRADEFAYDAASATVVVTNPNDDTPFVSIIDANARKVIGKIPFEKAVEIEQPVFNTCDGQFYVSVPSIPDTEYAGGAIARINVTALKISQLFPLPSCIPAGIALGSANQLFIGCSAFQISVYHQANSYIMDLSTGAIIANISNLAGIDQVAYSARTNSFLASAYKMQQHGRKDGAPAPVLAVVDAHYGRIVQRIRTDNVTAHSVAVDAVSGKMFVPIQKEGIRVYDLWLGPAGQREGSD